MEKSIVKTSTWAGAITLGELDEGKQPDTFIKVEAKNVPFEVLEHAPEMLEKLKEQYIFMQSISRLFDPNHVGYEKANAELLKHQQELFALIGKMDSQKAVKNLVV